MQYSSRIRIVGATSATLLLAVVVSDWPTGIFSGFWVQHAILTNVVSSVLFLILGATLVERWLARQEAAQFAVIESTAFGAVARSPLAIRRALWFLINGGNARGDEDFPVSEAEHESITRILERHGFQQVEASAVGRGDVGSPPDVPRVVALVRDEEWLLLAHTLIRRTLHSSRAIVARWAHLLVTSRQSARALGELSAVLDDLRDVRNPLNPDHHSTILASQGEVRDFMLAWRRCFVNAAMVYEDFALTARTLSFDRWSVRLVQPEDLEILKERLPDPSDRTSTVGRVYGEGIAPDITFPDDVAAELLPQE